MNPLELFNDWNRLSRETVGWLQTLLRFNTSNPPGNELPAIKWLAELLRHEGIEPQIIESYPGRGNLVARLRGDGSLPPLLLTGHMDVVPANPADWTHHPFEGTIADNCIWGRGALDMKGAVAMFTAALVLFQRLGIRLKRDLILAVVADEESGGRYGAQFLVERHPHLVQAEYALGEVGGFSMPLGNRRFYPIQVAERGHCRLTLKFTGTSSHGSLPSEDNALVKAAKAAAILAETRLPYHRCEPAIRFLTTLADHLPFPQSLALRALLNRGLAKIILDRFPDRNKARSFVALLHNTVNPTIFSAGTAVNVVPDQATLQIDGRIIPGISQDQFLEEIQTVLGDGYELDIDLWLPPTEAPLDDPIIEAMGMSLRKEDPEAVVLPYLMPGFTDGKHFSRLGIKFYGFTPMKLDESIDFQSAIHGVDERAPLEAITFGVKVLSDFLSVWCAL